VASARLLESVAREMQRRVVGEGEAAWEGYPTSFLLDLAQHALTATISGSAYVGNCVWDGKRYQLVPPGRWCCVNDHCLPAG
jgi:hypothetical protein